MILINNSDTYNKTELKELFSSVGWAQNLSEDQLFTAMSNSSHIVTARDGDKLVGLVRSMDDDIYSANIDCMVVHASYHKKGIAKAMLKALLETISHIEYISVAPDSSATFPLYASCGFKVMEESRLLQLNKSKE